MLYKVSPRFLALTYVVITRLQLLCFLTTVAENYVSLSLIRFIMQWAMEWKEERDERCIRCAKKDETCAAMKWKWFDVNGTPIYICILWEMKSTRMASRCKRGSPASTSHAPSFFQRSVFCSLIQKRRVQYILDMNIKLFVSFFYVFRFHCTKKNSLFVRNAAKWERRNKKHNTVS